MYEFCCCCCCFLFEEGECIRMSLDFMSIDFRVSSWMPSQTFKNKWFTDHIISKSLWKPTTHAHNNDEREKKILLCWTIYIHHLNEKRIQMIRGKRKNIKKVAFCLLILILSFYHHFPYKHNGWMDRPFLLSFYRAAIWFWMPRPVFFGGVPKNGRRNPSGK